VKKGLVQFDRTRRLKRVHLGLSQDNLEAFLFTDLANVFYLSGFRGSDGALLVSPDESILLVDGRYGAQAKEQAPECRLVVYPQKKKGISDEILQLKIKKLGFESSSMTVRFHQSLKQNLPAVEWGNPSDWYSTLRAQKDLEERDLMRRANKIADSSIEKVLQLIHEGISERDIAIELEYEMKKKGAEGASFPILVASGERTALPHAKPTSRKLKKGDVCFIDFGCTLDGYQTDQTISFSIGSPQKKWVEIHEIVKTAHDRAIEEASEGKSVADLDSVARGYIDEKGYGKYFTHSLGHGVGIEVHEYPRLSGGVSSKLESGMVFTIEPGIYIPGEGGVRIEDTLILTEKGVEFLTTVDKAFRRL